MADEPLKNLMNAIMRAEKQYGDNHQYRHVFAALREARYAASRVSANTNWESPGQREARESAAKVAVPEATDERNPNVPDSATAEGGTNGAGADSSS